MKKILFLTLVMAVSHTINAQKYLHYYMNDSSYYGFYTSAIDSITNNTDFTVIHLFDTMYSIPLDVLDSIVVEAANIEDDTAINYRSYEFNLDESQPFRKLIIDNRTMTYASRNGSFNINDTVIIMSEFNHIKMACTTDSLGRIQEIIMDTNLFIYFDYYGDSCSMVLFPKVDSVWIRLDTCITGVIDSSKSVAKSCLKQLSKTLDWMKSKWPKIREWTMSYSDRDRENLNYALHVNIANDFLRSQMALWESPEFRPGRIIVDGLFVVRDIIEIMAGCLLEAPSGGLSTALVVASCISLCNDMWAMMEDWMPTSDRMDQYLQYLIDRYGLYFQTNAATDISSCGAVLHGSVWSTRNFNGTADFHLQNYDDLSNADIIAAVNDNADSPDGYYHNFHAIASGLESGAEYVYSVFSYKFNCGGLKFRYYKSVPRVFFNTLTPSAVTGNVVSTSLSSISIACSFENLCIGDEHGISYTIDGGSTPVLIPSSSLDCDTITISVPTPCSTIEYKAYIHTSTGEYIYGNTRSASSSAPSAVGTWTITETKYDNQGNPYYESSSITLNADGTANVSDYYNYGVYGGTATWSASCAGITISITSPGNSSDSGVIIRTTYNTPGDFTHLSGTATYWVYSNYGYGYHESGYSITFNR